MDMNIVFNSDGNCRQLAERSRNPLDKERWLKIAQDWMKMTQEAEPDPNTGRKSDVT